MNRLESAIRPCTAKCSESTFDTPSPYTAREYTSSGVLTATNVNTNPKPNTIDGVAPPARALRRR